MDWRLKGVRPMGLSSLSSHSAPIIADTSTVINIAATGCGTAILRAIPNDFLITDVVLDELQQGHRLGRKDSELIAQLTSEGLVSIVEVKSLSNNEFERLVSGAGAVTLDDGEAATIACALDREAIALIDERKARRVCRDSYPELLVGNTIDLLSHQSIEAALGRLGVADAIYGALSGARMRVLHSHMSWVVALIGQECAAGVKACLDIFDSLTKQRLQRGAVSDCSIRRSHRAGWTLV